MADPQAVKHTASTYIYRVVRRQIERLNTESERSAQSASNVLGVSDIGLCREKARRMILNEEPTQQVSRYDLAAFIGTAVGDALERGIVTETVGMASTADDGEVESGWWVRQDTVDVHLTVRGWKLRLVGHPDLYCPTDLIDFKTKNGLGVVRKSGPSQKEIFQTALYAAGLIRAGRMSEPCWLHLVYLDRSGEDTEPYIHSRLFSWAEFWAAEEWLDDVLYAVEHHEEASRDKPREFCWAACEFAPACRGEDTDVEGLITDPEVIDALTVRAEAMETMKMADKDKRSAESILRRVSGSTGEWRIRSIEIPETVVPEQTRAGYTRLDIRPVRAKKPAVRKQRGTDLPASSGQRDVLPPPDEPAGQAVVGGAAAGPERGTDQGQVGPD